jgi:oxygen-independent coproporphyrinogen-3 oxidase
MEIRADGETYRRVCRNDSLPEKWRVPEGLRMDEKSPHLRTMVKHVLYDLLVEVTGRELPWGELIGIRPTKIARDMIAAGDTPDAAADFMKRTYSVSEEKAVLASRIAEREHSLLSRLHGRDGYSVYIGIPFCPTTCLYCSFPSFALHAWKEETDRYLDALEEEISREIPLIP